MAGRPRSPAVEGLVNLRDLGGLRRENGERTPTGVFFRSENVDAITARGWQQLHELGIRTVVDLRQPAECARDSATRPAWLTTLRVDLDGIEHDEFWKDYWDNGLVGTALYYAPHLEALPERAGAALEAIATAPAGGVLFHCMGGRDRTGMIAMLLLAAASTEPEAIVEDYLETVRLGEVRAAKAGRANDEPEIEAFCRSRGTTTEGAFRDALGALDIQAFLDRSGVTPRGRLALLSWRGTIQQTAPPGSPSPPRRRLA